MLPEAFLERMERMLGDEYEAFLESYGMEHTKALRLNAGKIGSDGRSAAEKYGIGEKGQSNAEKAGGEADKADVGFAHLSKVPWAEDGYYYQAFEQPGKHPCHEAGLYYIQEPSAMAPVELLDVRPGERVLDLCAAPGGKSTQIAAKLQGSGFLLCNEIHSARAKILSENIERMGIGNACVANETPERLAELFPAYFDCILVDAPCSGEGMFRKNEEACKEWSPENVRLCAGRQDRILDCAARMLRPGGRLVYSTCTFAPEEDEGSISRFLRRQAGFRIVPVDKEAMGLTGCDGMPDALAEPAGALADAGRGSEETGHNLEDAGGDSEEAMYGLDGAESGSEASANDLRGTLRLWPHRIKGEGHFAAVLKKDGNMPDGYRNIETNKTKNKAKAKGAAPEEFVSFCAQNLFFSPAGPSAPDGRAGEAKAEISESEGRTEKAQRAKEAAPDEEELLPALGRAVGMKGNLRYVQFGGNLYMAPADMPSLNGLKVLRPGLHLGEVKKNRFEPSHALALALDPAYAAHVRNLDSGDPAVGAYLNGQTFPAEGEKGWYLICVDGFGIGWGKLAGNIMKNHYPRGLSVKKFSGQ